MPDTRELILDRLFTVLGTVPGGVTVYRNRGDFPENKRPAILLLDGDEAADTKAFDRGRLGKAPNLVSMTPEIYAIIQSQKPSNETVGTVLNTFRKNILQTVLTDNTLQTLVGSNGEIRYDGCVTDLARGREMDGELAISISFKYVLSPNDL